MATGGRTTKRMTSAVFGTSPLKTTSGAAKVGSKVCDGYCEVFCHERNILLQELIDNKPDPTIIAEDITDFRTIADMVLGGACACKCDDISVIMPNLEGKQYKSLTK